MHSFPLFVLAICLPSLYRGQSIDTIAPTSPIKDPNAIMSRNRAFKLGFYSPEKTSNRYMAIFHQSMAVWIANRDRPLKDMSGVIAISKEGNLVLLNNGHNKEVAWSTNISRNLSHKNTTAKILDSGNLVLYDNSTGGEEILWESFSRPSHAWLPIMPLIDDTLTGNRVMLSSWKNESDPTIGSFRLGLEAKKIPQFVIWHSDGRLHYRSGPWNGQIFIASRHMYRSSYSLRITIDETSPGVFQMKAVLLDNSWMMIILNSSGIKSNMLWNVRNNAWDSFAFSPLNECDVYGKCGPFGVCDFKDAPRICSCLRGFAPVDRQEWESGNWTRGCKRKTALKCKNNNSRGEKEDGFLSLRNMKIPDYAERFASSREKECKIRCLKNCSCIAYAHDLYQIGCMFWKKEAGEDEALIDTQQFPNFGVVLHIRLAASELGDEKEGTLLIAVTATVIPFSILVLIFIARRWTKKKKGGKKTEKIDSNPYVAFSSESTDIFVQDQSKGSLDMQELPLFALETIVAVTNQFSDDNLIGEGGFGHVYKGKLENGEDIAVKRLSETSSQGVEEFLNEVRVISKLQHRNLVTLIGCCVDKEEKLLIYEYMTNKSLDVCLFDHSHPCRKFVDWENRLNIIKGIARGLLYLHKDSRLRIIHRDLKASNVLLDQEWCPKISDFGMARIFANNQDQANTRRVVGTYGYMAPEYAAEGVFSEKSDVYSLGVLILETISGRRNSYYNAQESSSSLSLLGHAWKYLKEEGNNIDAFPDEDILNSNSREEIKRCVHIALLCVQEFPEDRPTVQTVLSMLDGEIIDLPMAEKPLLAEKWNSSESTAQNQTLHQTESPSLSFTAVEKQNLAFIFHTAS